MNVHCKILNKIPATRIKRVLHKIIHPNQKVFVPYRYIGENIIEIISIIDKPEIKDNPGFLVSVDFYKAFNTLEWSFIKKVFEYFNFSEYLIKWIPVIYNNIDSQKINNRHMSEGFIVTRVLGRAAHCPHVFLSLQ